MKDNKQKILNVRDRIENGETVQAACKKEGLNPSVYYYDRAKNKAPNVIVHDIAAAPKKKYTKTVSTERCFVIVTSPSQLGSVLRGLQ